MIDYILPMRNNTAVVISSDVKNNTPFIDFQIVRTYENVNGSTLFDYRTFVKEDDYRAWNDAVRILSNVARRTAIYQQNHPKGLGYLDRAYLYIDDVKPELEELR